MENKTLILPLIIFVLNGWSSAFSQGNMYVRVDFIETMDYSEIPGVRELLKGLDPRTSSLHRYEYSNGKSSYTFVENLSPKAHSKDTGSSIYKDFRENKIYRFIDKAPGTPHCDTLKCPEWELHAEEKIIAGFTCRKASRAGTVAWYCESLPIPDGPKYECGLPGLILEVVVESIISVRATRVELSENGPEVALPPIQRCLNAAEFRRLEGF